MALRDDEKRAVEAFADYVRNINDKNSVSWKEGGDPPDAEMIINEQTYGVEVTTIPAKYTLALDAPKNAKAVQAVEARIIGAIRDSATQRGILSGRYYISFGIPKSDNVDQRNIVEQALNFIENTQHQETAEALPLQNGRFEYAHIWKTGQDKTFVELGLSSILFDYPEDIEPSCLALAQVLKEKAFLKDLKKPGPSILLVIHDPTTRPTDVYQKCTALLEIMKDFHTIFIVSNGISGSHQMLHTHNQNWRQSKA